LIEALVVVLIIGILAAIACDVLGQRRRRRTPRRSPPRANTGFHVGRVFANSQDYTACDNTGLTHHEQVPRVADGRHRHAEHQGRLRDRRAVQVRNTFTITKAPAPVRSLAPASPPGRAPAEHLGNWLAEPFPEESTPTHARGGPPGPPRSRFRCFVVSPVSPNEVKAPGAPGECRRSHRWTQDGCMPAWVHAHRGHDGLLHTRHRGLAPSG